MIHQISQDFSSGGNQYLIQDLIVFSCE